MKLSDVVYWKKELDNTKNEMVCSLTIDGKMMNINLAHFESVCDEANKTGQVNKLKQIMVQWVMEERYKGNCPVKRKYISPKIEGLVI